MAEAKKPRSIFRFLLLFLTLYIGMQLFLGTLFPSNTRQQIVPGPQLTSKSSFTIGNHPVLALHNEPAGSESFGVRGWLASKLCFLQRFLGADLSSRQCAALAAVHSGTPYTLENRCPQPNVDVFLVGREDKAGETLTPMASSETVVPCVPVPVVEPGETVQISLAPWKYSLFEKTGAFEVRLPGIGVAGAGDSSMQPVSSGSLAGQAEAVIASRTVARFSIVEPGIFRKTFRTFISAPFLNFLVFVASMIPGHNLGVAILALTLAVKILLFFPTQHALEGQKKMQMLQPKLEIIKARHKGEAKRIQEETMKLWREHNVNPFQSILPMLIQFPVLIGLFYVVRDASDFALSRHLLYGMYDDLPWQFGTSFLGLDLLRPDILVMPVMLVVLQFLQMKLSFSIQKRKKNASQRSAKETADLPAGGETKEKKADASPQEAQQKIMLYGLPLMIGFFALQFPAAVSLYWGISTIFGIGQQLVVNREHLRV